jgi:hypothetical protein
LRSRSVKRFALMSAGEGIIGPVLDGDGSAADIPRLNLPSPPGFRLTSGSFEIPEAVVKINLKPDLVGELLALLADAVELGVDATWVRPRLEDAAAKVAETASGREYLDSFVDLAVLANRHDLLSAADVDDVLVWAEEVRRPEPMPRLAHAEQREQWDEARAALQSWLDSQDFTAKKKLLRQRSIARVTCIECKSLLAWLLPHGGFEFVVLARGDSRRFEVAHAVGEYGGYARTRCGRRGGRTWVIHADHLRQWLDDGNADVNLRHADKGM